MTKPRLYGRPGQFFLPNKYSLARWARALANHHREFFISLRTWARGYTCSSSGQAKFESNLQLANRQAVIPFFLALSNNIYIDHSIIMIGTCQFMTTIILKVKLKSKASTLTNRITITLKRHFVFTVRRN